MNEEDTLLLDFYLGTGTDHMGRSLEEILSKDKLWLEETHDYIQWLFPLYVSSRFNPHAPVLTDEIREIFLDPAHAGYSKLQDNFEKSISKMLNFFGFMPGLDPARPEVKEVLFRVIGQYDESDNWPLHYHPWLRKGNHNQLRITRMLRSMTLLGRHELALSFLDALLEFGDHEEGLLEPKTMDFWKKAVVPVPDSVL
ncbi:MAG: hypothetical protein EAZ42_01570 [Verrucomicrobia bacterium]|nr:MAG: hypothetical protein EAZ42_01570 [Verrucomicrobiota bacterium]